MKRRIIAEEWCEFARTVLPVDVSPVQRTEMRRAFYAGWVSAIDRLGKEAAGSVEFTESDEWLMDSVTAEIADYALDLKAGRA